MVVFAVDIRGNAATERGKLSPRRNGWEKTLGQGKADDLREGNASLRTQQTALRIEVEQVLERQGGNDALVQAGVAVRAAIALGQNRSRGGASEIA